MKILFVVPYVPSLVRVRPYNLIRHLSALGHEVQVVTTWTSEQEREEAKQLTQYGHVYAAHLSPWRSVWNCVKAMPTSVPLQAVYSWQPALVRQILSQKLHVDVIHVEHLRGAHYGLAIKASTSNGHRPVPIIWDSVDCITHLFRQVANRSNTWLGRWRARFELTRTEKYEGWLVNQFNRVLVTTPAERTALLSLLPASRHWPAVNILTNGVDLDYFVPGDPTDREPTTIVVSGKMSYHANSAMVLHLVHDIMPAIWARRPELKLCVVGQAPPRQVQALGQDQRISIIGKVGDIRPYLQKAAVAVAPLTYGAGIQNKVLEAMACATPVVASPQAVSALAAQPGRDVLVGREPVEFARAVLQLLENTEQQSRVGQSGRHFVENHHRWNRITSQLVGIYDELLCAQL